MPLVVIAEHLAMVAGEDNNSVVEVAPRAHSRDEVPEAGIEMFDSGSPVATHLLVRLGRDILGIEQGEEETRRTARGTIGASTR